MNLHKKQLHFADMILRLLIFAKDKGYKWKIGWAYRPKYVAKKMGFEKSLHCRLLAIDIELYKDGKYVTETEGHTELGEYWESIGGTWGGRFSNPDGCHYSLEHNGIR